MFETRVYVYKTVNTHRTIYVVLLTSFKQSHWDSCSAILAPQIQTCHYPQKKYGFSMALSAANFKVCKTLMILAATETQTFKGIKTNIAPENGWKWMVGIRSCPFGMAFFQRRTVSFMEHGSKIPISCTWRTKKNKHRNLKFAWCCLGVSCSNKSSQKPTEKDCWERLSTHIYNSINLICPTLLFHKQTRIKHHYMITCEYENYLMPRHSVVNPQKEQGPRVSYHCQTVNYPPWN